MQTGQCLDDLIRVRAENDIVSGMKLVEKGHGNKHTTRG